MYKVYGTETKKMLNMLILEILQRYSDEEHHLTQQEILRLLKQDYGAENVDRRTVKANCLSLVDMGFEISMEDGDGYYLMSREFEEAELRMLIDSVLFSKTLSRGKAKELIEKLENQGSKYFEAKVSHVKLATTMQRTDNKIVLVNVGTLNDAIDQKKKISFRYKKYGTDLKMHDQGKEYVMNPYQMVASNGHYYLLGNIDSKPNVTYYRIDKMTDVVILDEKAKAQKDVKGLDGQLNLSKHMAEHIYLLCGESINVKMRTPIEMIDTLVDWFGKDFHILESNDADITILVRCNEKAIFYWALQYGPSVEVLEPKSLREELRKEIIKMAEKYKA